MVNFLATSSSTLGYGVKSIAEIDLNWIGDIISGLIGSVGIVGLGIIVFTIILKSIVLPLDIYSRIKMKKQALIMEKMRPQMEKLQKQYANDKNLYSQKVMELQKKSGYSMLSACLPTIVSLVIFMVVFSAFSTYSQYANLESYNDMVDVYNGVVSTYVIDESGNEKGFLYEVTDADGNVTDYTVDYGRFATVYNAEKATTYGSDDEVFLALADEYKAANSGYASAFSAAKVNERDGENLTLEAESIRNVLVSYYLEAPAAQEVAEYYEEHNNGFLWVGNLWYPDSTLNKEVPSFDKFQSTITKANIGDDYEDSYNKVTANLETEKNTYNGYYVLIALSIILMLLQQWIAMKMNKSTNDLNTVDGSGARTSKYMMIIMPIIYGIFAFMYSASFSLYMITNTIYSIITSLIINFALNAWFKKKEENGGFELPAEKKARKAAQKAKSKRK